MPQPHLSAPRQPQTVPGNNIIKLFRPRRRWPSFCKRVPEAAERHPGDDHRHIHLENTIVLKYLCNKQHAKIDAVDKKGLTPLHLACANYKEKSVQYLCESGADPLKYDDNQFLPLDHVVVNGSMEIVDYLSKTYNINLHPESPTGLVPVCIAVRNKNFEYLIYVTERYQVPRWKMIQIYNEIKEQFKK